MKKAFPKRVAVVGLGYVGMPTALAIAQKNIAVLGVDINEKRVAMINSGKSFIREIPDSAIQDARKFFRATANFGELKECDVVVIAVPTPLTKNKTPDVSFIESATQKIAPHIAHGALVILESTTYPGTTDELVLPILEKGGKKLGRDFFLGFAPERVDPGNTKFHFTEIPKVVGGCDSASTKKAVQFYESFLEKVHPVSSARAAEMTKLLENIFRLVNISLVNELKMLSDKMGIDFYEVIEAAKTKPYGFMPFYPGPGVGGHCLAGSERVVLEIDGELQTSTLEEVYAMSMDRRFALVPRGQTSSNDGSVTLRAPESDTQVLSFNPENGAIRSEPITALSRRIADKILEIECHYNYRYLFTEKHPVFVWDFQDSCPRIKFADELSATDHLLLPRRLSISLDPLRFDLIEMLEKTCPHFTGRFRVMFPQGTLKKHKVVLRDFFDGDIRKDEVVRTDNLSVFEFIQLERKLGVRREDLFLASGRGGGSFQKIPAIVTLDKEWARLIGYFLSEGCITEETKTMRLRWTFHAKEREYISDLTNILRIKNISFSTYKDKLWQSFHIKVSSLLLGVFFRDVLKTGVNCYTMKIPLPLFASTPGMRQEVLKGLLRGDGGVYNTHGEKIYSKNGKKYIHHNNSSEISYFTSSRTLFEQVQLILHEIGIVPQMAWRRGLLKIKGYENIKKLKTFFGSEKKKLVDDYLNKNRKKNNYGFSQLKDDFILLKVKSVMAREGQIPVYSMEVKNTNTFLVGGGVAVHNCIPLDPFYLSWKARELNFFTRFIDLAGEINELMPHHVVTRAIWALNKFKKPLNGSKVLVLGVAYKKDIDDPRESPAIPIIEDLLRKGAQLTYHDPYIPRLRIAGRELTSAKLMPALIKGADLVLILTDHSVFNYAEIAKNAKLVVDTRNAIKGKHKNVFH